ncbi:MAG: DUF4173 domain-containing protein [Pyrinomonadaceae bacterium MAG19_C2-C3]|nr:DUF4173 domain-containing protein [Pyrinomonadaceae bacterium MAG19_C2-C3]
MSNRTEMGLRILKRAVALGVVGNVLLREGAFGVNVPLSIAALIAVLLAFASGAKRRSADDEAKVDVEHARRGLTWDARRLLLPATFAFAMCVAWRDSAVLKTLDVMAVCVLLALVVLDNRSVRVRVAGVFDYVRGVVEAAFETWFGGVPLLLSDVKWGEVGQGRQTAWARYGKATVRGLMLALPIILVFAGLLMAADAVFSELVGDAFGFEADQAASHVFLTLLLAWLAAGFMRAVFLSDGWAGATPKASTSNMATTAATATTEVSSLLGATRPTSAIDEAQVESASSTSSSAGRGFKLGTIDVGIMLGALNALFLSFVLIQIRYLFGGSVRVLNTAGLTYAEYARHGFFELVWVAALTLALLLVVHHLLAREDKLTRRVFRVFAGSSVALVLVVMWSAMVRMRLYQSEYGLTELRLYTTAFMVWIGVTLVWFAWSVLMRDARRHFAVGAFASLLMTLMTLHLINPDALIVRANIAHATANRSFDTDYALTALSLDAASELIENLARLPELHQRYIAAGMLERHAELEASDWRAWSIARRQAWSSIARHLDDLKTLTMTVETTPDVNQTLAPPVVSSEDAPRVVVSAP